MDKLKPRSILSPLPPPEKVEVQPEVFCTEHTQGINREALKAGQEGLGEKADNSCLITTHCPTSPQARF